MGYPIFGKMKTITLPIPDAALTFAEYKDAYGIDLQNLPLVDLILIRQTDGECVPVLYIDKENSVMYTANYSIDYSTGFEVKSESLISEVIASGTIENAKSLYFHPITIMVAGSMYFSIVIINNTATAYTKSTLVTELNRIRSLAGETCRFPATGCFVNEGVAISPYNLEVPQQNEFKLYGFNGTNNISKVVDISNVDQIFDGVNKIN